MKETTEETRSLRESISIWATAALCSCGTSTFTVNRGDIFIIMGGSGCGKSTLLKILIGLKEPARGQVFYDGAVFGRRIPRSGNGS